MPRDNGFHPDLRKTARFLPRTSVTSRSLPVMRVLESLAFRGAKDVEALTLTSGGRVRLHRPPGDVGPTPALLWVHGGGYVAGTPRKTIRPAGGSAGRSGSPSPRPRIGARRSTRIRLRLRTSMRHSSGWCRSRRSIPGESRSAVKARAVAWLPHSRSWSATEARSPRSTAFELSDARRPDRVKPSCRAQLSAVGTTQ